jgi:hypothetical protein
VEETPSLPRRSAPAYQWPVVLNLLFLLLAGFLLPAFLHDPNLTVITLFLLAGLGLNVGGGVVALGRARWQVAAWFGLGILWVLSVCWGATHLVPPALLQQQ